MFPIAMALTITLDTITTTHPSPLNSYHYYSSYYHPYNADKYTPPPRSVVIHFKNFSPINLLHHQYFFTLSLPPLST